jgi:hypothetical protein
MELVLAERGLNSLSSDQVEGNAEKIILLNLSENNMNNSNLLDTFTSLETLILDKNGLTGLEWCCPIPSLKTLYFNNNQVSNVEAFVNSVATLFPQLEYLSMMRNPCCPAFFVISEEKQEDYRRHREFVLYKLPTLKFLDATAISEEERLTANRRGGFLGAKAKPKKKKSTSADLKQLAAQQAYEEQKKLKAAERKAKNKTSTFLGLGSNEARYESNASEGNRFIRDDDL